MSLYLHLNTNPNNRKCDYMEEKRNAFDEFSFAAMSALGSLMACNEVCRNQRAVMKINRFRAWLMDLKPQANPEQNLPFDGEQQNN